MAPFFTLSLYQISGGKTWEMDKKPENRGVLALEITILRCIILGVSCHPFVSGLSG